MANCKLIVTTTVYKWFPVFVVLSKYFNTLKILKCLPNLKICKFEAGGKITYMRVKDLQKDNDEKDNPNHAAIVWTDHELKRKRIYINTNQLEKKL